MTRKTAREDNAITTLKNVLSWHGGIEVTHDEIDFDEEPKTSEGENGVWVQVWIFVENDDE